MPAVDLETIEDECLLRKMWKEEEDLTEKRSIRSRMFALRERRLKDLHGSADESRAAAQRSAERDSRHRRLVGDDDRKSSPEKESSPESDESRTRRGADARGGSPRKPYGARSATAEVPAHKTAAERHTGGRARRAVSTVEPPSGRAAMRGATSPARKQLIDIVNRPENARVEIGDGQIVIDFSPDKFSKARRQVVLEYEGDRPDVQQIQKKLHELGLDALENIDIMLTGFGAERRTGTHLERTAVREFAAPAGAGQIVEIEPPEIVSDADVEVADGEILITIEPDDEARRRQLMWSFSGTEKPSCAALRQKLENFTFSDIERLDDILADLGGHVLEDTKEVHEDANGRAVSRHRKVIQCGGAEPPVCPPPAPLPRRPRLLEVALAGSGVSVWVPATVGEEARQFVLRYPHGTPDLDQVLCVLENSGPAGLDELLQDLECRVTETSEPAVDGEPVRTTHAELPTDGSAEPAAADGGPELRLRDGQIQLSFEPASEAVEVSQVVVVHYDGMRPDVQALVERVRRLGAHEAHRVDEVLAGIIGEVLVDETEEEVDAQGRRVIRRKKVIRTEPLAPQYAAVTRQPIAAEVSAPPVSSEEVSIDIKGKDVVLLTKVDGQQNEVTVTLEDDNPDLKALEDQLRSLGFFSPAQITHVMKRIASHLDSKKKKVNGRTEKRNASNFRRAGSLRGSTRGSADDTPGFQRAGSMRGPARSEPFQRTGSTRGPTSGSVRGESSRNKVAELSKRFTATATHTVQRADGPAPSRRPPTKLDEADRSRRVEAVTRRLTASRDASPTKRPSRTPARPGHSDTSPTKHSERQRRSDVDAPPTEGRVQVRDGEVVVDLGEGERRLVVEYDGSRPDVLAIQRKLRDVGLDDVAEIERILAGVEGEVLEDSRHEEAAEDGTRVITRTKVIRTRKPPRESPPRAAPPLERRQQVGPPTKPKQPLTRAASGRASGRAVGRVSVPAAGRVQSKNERSSPLRSEGARNQEERAAAGRPDPGQSDPDQMNLPDHSESERNHEPHHEYNLPDHVAVRVDEAGVLLTMQPPELEERQQLLVTYEGATPDRSQVQELLRWICRHGATDLDAMVADIGGELLEESDEEVEGEDGSCGMRRRKVVRAPPSQPEGQVRFQTETSLQIVAQPMRQTTREFTIQLDNSEVDAVENNTVLLKPAGKSDSKPSQTASKDARNARKPEAPSREARRSSAGAGRRGSCKSCRSDSAEDKPRRSSGSRDQRGAARRTEPSPVGQTRPRAVSPSKPDGCQPDKTRPCTRTHHHAPGVVCTRKAPLDTGLSELRRRQSSTGKPDSVSPDRERSSSKAAASAANSPRRARQPARAPASHNTAGTCSDSSSGSSSDSDTESVTEEFVYYSNKEDSPDRPLQEDTLHSTTDSVSDLPADETEESVSPDVSAQDLRGSPLPREGRDVSQREYIDVGGNPQPEVGDGVRTMQPAISREQQSVKNAPPVSLKTQAAAATPDGDQVSDDEPAVKSVRNKLSLFEHKMQEVTLSKPSAVKSPRTPRKATIWDTGTPMEEPISPSVRDLPHTPEFSQRRNIFNFGEVSRQSEERGKPVPEMLSLEQQPREQDISVVLQCPLDDTPFKSNLTAEIDHCDLGSSSEFDLSEPNNELNFCRVQVNVEVNQGCPDDPRDRTEYDGPELPESMPKDTSNRVAARPYLESVGEPELEFGDGRTSHRQSRDESEPERASTRRSTTRTKDRPAGSRPDDKGDSRPADKSRELLKTRISGRRSSADPVSKNKSSSGREPELVRKSKETREHVLDKRTSRRNSHETPTKGGKTNGDNPEGKASPRKTSAAKLKRTKAPVETFKKRSSSGHIQDNRRSSRELLSSPVKSELKGSRHRPKAADSPQYERPSSPPRDTTEESGSELETRVHLEIVDRDVEDALPERTDELKGDRSPSPPQEPDQDISEHSPKKAMGSGLLDKLTFLALPDDAKEAKSDGVLSPDVNEDKSFNNGSTKTGANNRDAFPNNCDKSRQSASPVRESSPVAFRRQRSFKSSRLAKAFEKFETRSTGGVEQPCEPSRKLRLDRKDSMHRARDKFQHLTRESPPREPRRIVTRASPEKSVTVMRAHIELDPVEPRDRGPVGGKAAADDVRGPRCSEDDGRQQSPEIRNNTKPTHQGDVEYQEDSYTDVKQALQRGKFPYRRMVSSSSVTSDTSEQPASVDEARRLNRADSRRSAEPVPRESSPQKQALPEPEAPPLLEPEEPQSARLVGELSREQHRSSFRNVTRLSNLRYNPDSEFMDDLFSSSRGDAVSKGDERESQEREPEPEPEPKPAESLERQNVSSDGALEIDSVTFERQPASAEESHKIPNRKDAENQGSVREGKMLSKQPESAPQLETGSVPQPRRETEASARTQQDTVNSSRSQDQHPSVQSALFVQKEVPVEEIEDLAILEKLLDEAKDYDERFKLRTRIRLVKRKTTTTARSSLFCRTPERSRSPAVGDDSITTTTTTTSRSCFEENQHRVFEAKSSSVPKLGPECHGILKPDREITKEQKTKPMHEETEKSTSEPRIASRSEPQPAQIMGESSAKNTQSESPPEHRPTQVPNTDPTELHQLDMGRTASPSLPGSTTTAPAHDSAKSSPLRWPARKSESDEEPHSRRGSRGSRRGSRDPAVPPIVHEPDEDDPPEQQRLKMEYASRFFHSSDPLDRPKIEEVTRGADDEETEDEDSDTADEAGCSPDDRPGKITQGQSPNPELGRVEPLRDPLGSASLPKTDARKDGPEKTRTDDQDTDATDERSVARRSAQHRVDRDKDFKPKSSAEPLKSKVDKFERAQPDNDSGDSDTEELSRVEEPAWLKRSSAPRGKPATTDAEKVSSSYGVGPTDHCGLPLFGLRALRKQKPSQPPAVEIKTHKPEPDPEPKPEPKAEPEPTKTSTADIIQSTPTTDEPYSESRLPLFGGLRAMRTLNRPDGSSVVSDAEDERAGSDVEEIEARAREQERLLSGGKDGATGDAKLSAGVESRPNRQRSSLIPRLADDRSPSSSRAPAGDCSPSGSLGRRPAGDRSPAPGPSPAGSPAGTAERHGGRTPSNTADNEDRKLTSILKKPRSAEVITPTGAVTSPMDDVTDAVLQAASGEEYFEEEEDVEEDGHEEDGHEEDRHEEDGHEEDGHEEDGHEEDGHEEDGHEEDGHEEDGHEEDDDRAPDGSPPTTLIQTKSPMVQRRGSGGRFGRRGPSHLPDDDDCRVPLRKTTPASAGVSRNNARNSRPVVSPADGLLKLASDDRVSADRLNGDASPDSENRRLSQTVPSVDDCVNLRPALSPSTPAGDRSSFLDNRSKVTGIRDVLTRMDASNADVISPDGEARSLLNKFLGAQVMMTGMESMMAQSSAGRTDAQAAICAAGRTPSTGPRSQRSQFRTSRDEDAQWKGHVTPSASKTPAAGEVVVVSGVNISEVTDQDKLHELLEQCDNFDERKKIRARLMTLMQEVRARREQASRRRLEHQQQRDGGSVSQHEAKMINDWLSDNFDSDGGKDSTSESKTTSSSSVTTKTSTETTKTRTVASSPRTPLSKGKAPVSAFDKFKQLDSANPRAMPPRTDSAASDGSGGGGFKLDPGLAAKAQSAKEMTLYWAQSRVREYKNVKVENFSTSWNNGMAFCALIHHFYPDAFDFDKLDPKNRRYNFDLAFNTADEKAGIFPLLDTDDMVAMKKPDWKCVFTYVQAIYRRLKNGP